MYHQINPTEMFREHHLALLEEAEERRLARRLRAGREPKARSVIAASSGFLAALVVAGLMLVALSSPAHASTTFTVNSTANTRDSSPDGTCDSCTLREAIQEANSNNNPTETDRINFNISDSVDPGVKTISPGAALPQITEPVIINGYSQPGSSVNALEEGTNAKLMIELNGTKVESGDGLQIAAKNTVVKGLVINSFGFAGIALFGGSDADGAKIQGNFIGTNPTGERDEGNDSDGVRITGNSNVVVGGTSRGTRNLISGNRLAGITFFNFETGSNNKVQGNLIGTHKDGSGNLGNGDSGVAILANEPNNSATTVENNTIAFNGSIGAARGTDGVALFGDVGTTDTILSNSIFSNDGLGIDLVDFPDEDGLTDVSNANDPGDTDEGPNDLQNKPVLTSAKTSGTKLTIVGNLNSTPNRTFTVQFFSNPSGGDEGKTFRAQRSVTTNDNGNASFSFGFDVAVPVGQSMTATATGAGDTSEFSAPRVVVAQ